MNFKAVFKGTAITLIITFLVILAVSVVNMFVGLSENAVRLIILAGMSGAILFSSIGVSSNCEKMKLANSVFLGICCMICICIATLMINGGIKCDIHFLTVFVCCTAAAALGTFMSK